MSHILVIDQNGSLKKKIHKVTPSDKRFNEASLQAIIHNQPQVLRANLIDETYEKMIPLSRELSEF